MRNSQDLQEVKNFVQEGSMKLLYLSRPECGVCTVVKSKVEKILERYEKLEGMYVNMDEIPQSAGEYSLFTIPGILLYIDGKEMIREARYFSMEELESRIDRFYNLLFH